MTSEFKSRKLVLYADDDQDDIDMVKDGFSTFSNTVDLKTFSDGDEVISFLLSDIAVNTRPCLVILDINMTRMDGKR